MNATTLTFAQYAEQTGATTPDRLELARKEYDLEQAAAACTPDPLPACPAWCALPVGHGYDSISGTPAAVELSRIHASSEDGTALVSCVETYAGGAVTLDAATVELFASDRLTADQARTLAADLATAAELLDSL